MGPACYRCRECGGRGHLARDCARTVDGGKAELHSEEDGEALNEGIKSEIKEEYGENIVVKEEELKVDIKQEYGESVSVKDGEQKTEVKADCGTVENKNPLKRQLEEAPDDRVSTKKPNSNYIGQLQDLVQKLYLPKYREVVENELFSYEVTVGGRTARGVEIANVTNKGKKKAKQSAARMLLDSLRTGDVEELKELGDSVGSTPIKDQSVKVRNILCGKCDERFTSHSAFTQHNLSHVAFKCTARFPTCTACFKNAYLLAKHKRVHPSGTYYSSEDSC